MLLIPFLDILCSLIGVLVLIILFLVMSQTSQVEGRTKEEVDRAQEYQRLKKQLAQNKDLQEKILPMLDKLKQLEKELKEKEEKAAKLRMLQQQATNAKLLNENLKKELDNLLLEITGYEQQIKDLKKEIEELLKQIKELQIKAKTPPPVVVQPGGGGMAADSKNYFIEASGGKIILYWDEQRQTLVSSTPEAIVADPAYQDFLTKVKADPKSKIIFMIREDGATSYNNAAGWAQQTYGFSPSQVAKLPIPGRGAIKLDEFRKYIGSVPPPPDAKFLPPPGSPAAAAPAPAPAKPAAAPAPAATPPAPPKPAAKP